MSAERSSLRDDEGKPAPSSWLPEIGKRDQPIEVTDVGGDPKPKREGDVDFPPPGGGRKGWLARLFAWLGGLWQRLFG